MDTEIIRYLIDYGVIGLLIVLNILVIAIAIERCGFYNKVSFEQFQSKTSLDIVISKRRYCTNNHDAVARCLST